MAGDSSLYDLAEQGYALALKFDGSNWLARYYLGLLYLDQRKFPDAQKNIGEALLANGDNPEIVYSMLYASYYSGDPKTAQAMLERLQQLNPNDPRILRVSPLIAASLNNPDLAKAELDKYTATAKDSSEVRSLASRVADWKRFYDSLQSEPPDMTGGTREGNTAAPAPALSANERTSPVQESGSFDEEMVAVDVVMISTEESVSTRKGVNLLNGLSLQYGWNYKYDKSMKDTNDIGSATNAAGDVRTGRGADCQRQRANQ